MSDPLRDVLTDALSGRYRVERRIGEGGMALVYLARDLRHDRPVALKVIRPELAKAVNARRLQREIRVTATLTHPNIRPLLDSGEVDGIPFFVMPYLEGRTLRDRLDGEGPLPLDEALRIASDVADALDHAHRSGVIHRDVKPSNIFLEGEHALLGDFGIALPPDGAGEDRLTATAASVGTPTYMSPEQAGGDMEVDARSDVYSLGCVLFEMLTGQAPFTGRTRQAVVARHLSEPAPSPRVLRADLPPHVERAVARCLAKAPADRFPTAGALRRALVEPAPRPEARRWRRPAVVAALAVVVAGSALAAWPRLDDLLGSGSLDPTKVVVFPLANRGAGEATGGDVALMIGNALVHAEPLRAIDGWQWMEPERRDDPGRLSLAEARRIARARGAAHFITGGVTSESDSLTVVLDLYDTAGDSLTGRASARGPARVSSGSLGVRALVDLLPPLLDPGRTIDLSYLADRAPAALARWIEGDQAYRAARFPEALGHYRAAVAIDSLVVPAAVKGALAAQWAENLAVAVDMVELAVRHDSLLPVRHRNLARGMDAYLAGRAREASDRFQRALALDPEWAEAWSFLGEVRRHLLPAGQAPDASDEAWHAAARHDPDFLPPLIHLAESALREGDPDEGSRLLDRLEEAGLSARPPVRALRLLETCVRDGEAALAAAAREEPDDGVLREAAAQMAVGMRHPRCAEAAYRRLLERAEPGSPTHWTGVVGLAGILVSEGRDREAAGFLDAMRAHGSGVLFLYLLGDLAGADLGERATDVEALVLDRWGPEVRDAPPSIVYVMAAWWADRGRVAGARAAADRLDEAAGTPASARSPSARAERIASLAASGDTAGAARAVFAAAARGQALAAEGRSEEAIELLEALEPAAPREGLSYGFAEPLALERRTLAGLLAAAGRSRDAWKVARSFDHPQAAFNTWFVPGSLAVRHRAASRLDGETWRDRAAEAADRLHAMGRADLLALPPDPSTEEHR